MFVLKSDYLMKKYNTQFLKIKKLLKIFLKKIFLKIDLNYRYNNYLLKSNKIIHEQNKQIKQMQDTIILSQKLITQNLNKQKELNKLAIDKILNLENIAKASIDIEKIPKAKGNIRLIQLCYIKIFKKFKEICKKHNLSYWIDYGTLIGSVRHGGFIPWDDDFDISMMREDYNKLHKVIKKEIKGTNFELRYGDYGPIMQLCIKNLPLFLDIFPQDFIHLKIEKDFYNKFLIKKQQIYDKYNQLIGDEKNYENRIEKLDLIKKEFKEYFDKLNPKKINKELLFITRGLESRHGLSLFRYKDIFPLKKVMFEKSTGATQPNNPSVVLSQIFGDYWSFPYKIDFSKHFNAHSMSPNLIEKINKELQK